MDDCCLLFPQNVPAFLAIEFQSHIPTLCDLAPRACGRLSRRAVLGLPNELLPPMAVSALRTGQADDRE
jgi:hypothetical protein